MSREVAYRPILLTLGLGGLAEAENWGARKKTHRFKREETAEPRGQVEGAELPRGPGRCSHAWRGSAVAPGSTPAVALHPE